MTPEGQGRPFAIAKDAKWRAQMPGCPADAVEVDIAADEARGVFGASGELPKRAAGTTSEIEDPSFSKAPICWEPRDDQVSGALADLLVASRRVVGVLGERANAVHQ